MLLLGTDQTWAIANNKYVNSVKYHIVGPEHRNTCWEAQRTGEMAPEPQSYSSVSVRLGPDSATACECETA